MGFKDKIKGFTNLDGRTAYSNDYDTRDMELRAEMGEDYANSAEKEEGSTGRSGGWSIGSPKNTAKTENKKKNFRPAPEPEIKIFRGTTNTNHNLEVFFMKPNSFDDSDRIAELLLSEKSVFLNFEDMDLDTEQRVVDFTAGVCKAIGGDMKICSKRQNLVYVFPSSVQFNGDDDFEKLFESNYTSSGIKRDF